MTEKPLSASTQSAPPVQPTFSLEKPSFQDAFPKINPKKEEDSIQCICNYPDDDGNTIFCEECKTWQHIACYYPGRENEALEEEFRHSCADCEPRQLDRHRAAERMQIRLGLQQIDGEPHDKKHKKPPSKTHKKKSKPSDLQLNGNTVGADGTKHGSPLDHPPAKKAKTSHRSSHSVSAQVHKRSPSHSAPKLSHHAHPLSPATTPPDLPIDFEFQSSYHPSTVTRRQDSVQIVDNNTTANLKTRNFMSSWSKPDSGQFRQDTKLEFRDVVQMMSPTACQPAPFVGSEEVTLPGGNSLLRTILVLPSAVAKDVPLLELNGLIGLQKEYCEDSDNRYAELCAPLPFVFFPPYFPLYIDTRNEGSNARYALLSCHPNARLETYISDDSDYHFWLVSDRSIAANEKITLAWDFRLPEPLQGYMERLLSRNDEDNTCHPVTEIDQSGYKSLADWIFTLLTEYGGCACNAGDDCAFTRFKFEFEEKVQVRPGTQKRKRAKSRPHTISPTSTGQATNSRAPSEGHLEEVSEADLNADGASRSKPSSRDRTPARLGSFDTPAILTEQTNRDKRKVQIVETLFQKSAQEQQQSTRKKKKSIADSATNMSKPKARIMTQTSENLHGADGRRSPTTAQSAGKANSPTTTGPYATTNVAGDSMVGRTSVASESRRSPSCVPRNYVSIAIQTDSEDSKDSSRRVRPQRRVISLAMRLMNQRRLDTLRAQERSANAMDLGSPVTSKGQVSPSTVVKQTSPPSPTVADTDTLMVDAPPMATVSPAEISPSLSNGTEVLRSPATSGTPDPQAQVHSASTFTSPTSATSVTTLSSTTPSVHVFVPLPALVVNGATSTSSPIKKKMSLSEYKNKAIKAAASAKPLTEVSHPLKTASSIEDALVGAPSGDQDTKEAEHPAPDTTSKEMSTA